MFLFPFSVVLEKGAEEEWIGCKHLELQEEDTQLLLCRCVILGLSRFLVSLFKTEEAVIHTGGQGRRISYHFEVLTSSHSNTECHGVSLQVICEMS